MTTSKGRPPPTTEAVDAAIAQHIRSAASLMAAKTDHGGPGATSDAEIIARLDLILAKLEKPAVPLSAQLWTLAEIAHYLRKHVETVREAMSCLPNFPAAIRVPARNGARGHALYEAEEVIEWAKSYKEKR